MSEGDADLDPTLPLERLNELLTAIRGLRVGVVGDFTLDGYWVVDMERAALSRETPLFARPVVRERYSCGGAANVAWNLAALEPISVRAFTILSDDWRGQVLRRVLADVGVEAGDCIQDTSWSTPFFGKVILTAGERQQEDARIDFVNTAPPGPEAEERLLQRIEAALPELDALVIADYQPVGVITDRVLDRLNELAMAYPTLTITVDSRERIGRFQNMVRKPNAVEAARWLFPDLTPELVGLDDFAEVALHPQVDCGCPLFITLGKRGCLVLDGGESHLALAVPVPPPLDPVGAGDTFLSAISAGLAAGANPLEAARLGNLAAAVTVRKLGVTGAALPEEILALAGGWEVAA